MARTTMVQQTDTGGSGQYITISTDGTTITSQTKPVDFSYCYPILESKYKSGAYSYVSGRDDWNIVTNDYGVIKASIISVINPCQDGPRATQHYNGFPASYYSGNPHMGCLPNCTSWAAARVLELMLATGLAAEPGPNQINSISAYTDIKTSVSPQLGGEKKYNIKFISNNLLAQGDASSWFNDWPSASNLGSTRNYWKNLGWGTGQEPRAGAVACWGIDNRHVAFVEKVLSNGDIVVTESGRNNANTNKRFASFRLVKKSDNYGYGFSGFCYTPLCDLLTTSTITYDPVNEEYTQTTTTQTIVIDTSQPSFPTPEDEEEKRKQEEFSMYDADGELQYNIQKGSKVRVIRFGNTKIDGTGNKINKNGLIGYIIKDWGLDYSHQYEVGIEVSDSKGNPAFKSVGFFDRRALTKLE